MSWLKESLQPAELQKLEAGNTDRPEAQTPFGIQARNLAKMNAAGVRIAIGSDGNNPWAPHVEMADMVAAGMTAAQVIVAATRNGAEFLRMTDSGTIEAGKSADFSSSTRTRSTTSPTHGGSRRCTCAASPSTAQSSVAVVSGFSRTRRRGGSSDPPRSGLEP